MFHCTKSIINIINMNSRSDTITIRNEVDLLMQYFVIMVALVIYEFIILLFSFANGKSRLMLLR